MLKTKKPEIIQAYQLIRGSKYFYYLAEDLTPDGISNEIDNS